MSPLKTLPTGAATALALPQLYCCSNSKSLRATNFQILALVTVHHERRVKREKNQQDATNLMFIIKLLSQHVSGIIMPIIRRKRVCTATYGVLDWLCGAGTRAVCTVKVTVHSAHNSLPRSTQPQPSQPVQNTICGSAHSCSPDDGHNDARNMLR